MFGGKNFPAKHVSQFNLKQAAYIHTYKIRPLSVSKKTKNVLFHYMVVVAI